MAQMGYVVGTGLGRNGEGRLEPVEALVFPPGKSLGKYDLWPALYWRLRVIDMRNLKSAETNKTTWCGPYIMAIHQGGLEIGTM